MESNQESRQMLVPKTTGHWELKGAGLIVINSLRMMESKPAFHDLVQLGHRQQNELSPRDLRRNDLTAFCAVADILREVGSTRCLHIEMGGHERPSSLSKSYSLSLTLTLSLSPSLSLALSLSLSL